MVENRNPKIEDKNPIFSSKLFPNMTKAANFSRMNIRENGKNIDPWAHTTMPENELGLAAMSAQTDSTRSTKESRRQSVDFMDS